METYRLVLWLNSDNGICILQKFSTRRAADNHALNMGFGSGDFAYSVIAIVE